MTMTRFVLLTELGNFMELNFLGKRIFLIFYCWCHKCRPLVCSLFNTPLKALGSKTHPIKDAEE